MSRPLLGRGASAVTAPRLPQGGGLEDEMHEYFIVANSFAAPFFSDQSDGYQHADSPEEALLAFVAAYGHPAGLYSAAVYASADAYHKLEKPLARWLCNHELAKQQATTDKAAYSYSGRGPGDFEINGERVTVDDPKGGQVVGPA